MHKVIVRAPVRADLAGGTLDLWPLYLFHPSARTVNVAISFYAESEVSETGTSAIEIHLTDHQYRHRYESIQEMAADPKAALLYRAVEHFKLNGLRIVTRTDAPRGSGLGGSSALAITLVRALSEIAGQPVDGEDLIFLVRDLETRLLGVPAGIQDYFPPVFGGLGSIHLTPGRPVRHALQAQLHDLGAHMTLHYSGVAHFSGTNNWEMYKRHIDGDNHVRKGLEDIAITSQEMEHALESSNFEAAGAALRKEWQQRKALIDGISTPEIDAAIEAATKNGAWAGKVCGAGGGGCIVFLHPPDRRDDVVRALGKVPGRVLECAPSPHGITVEHVRESGTPAPRQRIPSRTAEAPLEQLYVSGGRGDYRPFILAEGIVTHTEGRSGIHHQTARSYVAPVAGSEARVLWNQASLIDPEELDLRAVAENGRKVAADVNPETVLSNAAAGEEGFRLFLEQSERLLIFHNPKFGFFSEPAETRESFLARCMEEAERQLEDQQERLESTFRRRIDQLRERSEREDRKRDNDEDAIRSDKPQEVNVAWGQALYNITSGRPATTADPNVSIRETDYLENIAQIQKSWDRELEALREELTAHAKSIEEISIVPSAKNIEVTKYLVLWAANLP